MLSFIGLLFAVWCFFRLYTIREAFSSYDILIDGIYSLIGGILLCSLLVFMEDLPLVLYIVLWICATGMSIVGAWGILMYIERKIKNKKV